MNERPSGAVAERAVAGAVQQSATDAAIRLVHITTVPMSLGFLRGQVGYMRAHGFEVHAISSPAEELDAFARREGVAVRAVEMPRAITPLRDVRAVASLARTLSALRPAIAHAHTPKGGLLGMLAAAIARVPVRIYHMRGMPLMTASGLRRRLLRAAEIVSCRLAHRVICVSPSLRRFAIGEGLCPAGKITVLCSGSGNGVDATGRFDPDRVGHDARWRTRERLGIPRDAVVLGFVGRITRDKGAVELATAWRRLRERNPELHLLILGFFEAEDPVPADAERTLREDPRVHLVGKDWDAPPYYAAMDVVVLPSYREGFPNVPLEAGAMRLPVITTRATGCIDAVEDGRTGTLVRVGDAAALVDALQAYILDPGLRRRHGEAGRARVLREFRPEAIWEALREEYLRLLAARTKRAPVRP